MRVKVLTGAFLVAALLALAGCDGGGHYESVDSVAWDDYRPYAADLADPSILRTASFLKSAPVYHLSLSVANDFSAVDGSLAVRYSNQTGEPRTTIDLLLYPNLIAGSMTVSGVTADGVDCTTAESNGGTLLTVKLPGTGTLAAGGSLLLRMKFHATIPSGDRVGFGGFGYSSGVLSLGYEYPVIPDSGKWTDGAPPAWGDLTANPTAFYICQVSFPRGLVLAAPGTELFRQNDESQSRTTVLLAHGPARDLFLALGKSIQERTLDAGGTLIRSFAEVTDTAQSEAVLAAASRAVTTFSRSFGPYPYRSLTFVQSRLDAFGLEFPGSIIITPWLYGDPDRREGGVRLGTLLEATVAHETAHQWFYALVGDNQLEEPWIDEALAQYSTWKYYLDNYGSSAAQSIYNSFEARWRRVGSEGIPIGKPVRDYTPREYSAIIYGRAPLFLESLRRDLGKEAFNRLLRTIVERYSFRVVTGAAIEELARQIGGASVKTLWSRWVTGPDAP